MSLLETTEFRVTKVVQSTGTKTIRFEFVDPSGILLGYATATRGVDLVAVNDPNNMELFHLEHRGLYDSSGNKLAELKSKREGTFKSSKLAWQRDDGSDLLTYEQPSRGQLLLLREGSVRATIKIKAKLFQPSRHFEVSVVQDSNREDRLLILGLIMWLGALFM